ncbi:hypothetical protein O1L55_38445, partial [Streptomyces albulus]|nr:hypothetical protein [Streptomyces noursei]
SVLRSIGWCLTSIPFVVVCVFAFIVKRFRVFVRRFTTALRRRGGDGPTGLGTPNGTAAFTS